MNTTTRPSPLSVFRFSQGLTQSQLADRAHVARETVSRIERGAQPQARTATAIAVALGIAQELLFPPEVSG